jgi:hypothetical protein
MKALFYHAPSRALPSSGLIRRCSSMNSLLRASLYTPHSSGLDFLMEIHLRRAKTDTKAQEMTKKEQSMIRDGARRHQTTMILEEAPKFMDIDS